MAKPLNAQPPSATNNAASSVTSTNKTALRTNAVSEMHFPVKSYDLTGNTLLPEKTIQDILSKHTGTNVTFEDVMSAVKEVQAEYHNRGWDTVSVAIPQQKLTNGVFKLRVFEGRLATIEISGDKFFDEANIRRALPSLKTNVFLNTKVFQRELDQANANQDRQIYPEIHPGPHTNTTSLVLIVEDRLPLHAKIEANNQSSPGTPEDRINTSLTYNNLWQQDHSIGVQYSFSPQDFKAGDWSWYDKPLVANYSAFYRLPLTAPSSIQDTINNRPGSFGYSEATRKFELPPGSAVPDLTVFASRSTIDTGVVSSDPKRYVTAISGNTDEVTDHQDLTVNESLGFRVSEPLPQWGQMSSRVQFGADYKSFKSSSFETNSFLFTQFLFDTSGNPFTRTFTVPNTTPPNVKSIEYVPLSIRWDGSIPDKSGSTDLELSYSPNLWFTASTSITNFTGSAQSTGYWHILAASLSRDQDLGHGWRLNLRADGQWSSQPLISNEQFGIGGVNGIRGYREGAAFGDTGWRFTSEIKTPTHAVGYIGGGKNSALTVRASGFFDYGETYLLDPQGQPGRSQLSGIGIGGAASIGRRFDARLLFAWPLLNTGNTESEQIRVAFSLSAQF